MFLHCGIRTRATYLPDIIRGEMVVLEYNEIENMFISVDDNELRYNPEIILYDNDWIVVSIDDDEGVIKNVR